MYCLIMYMHLNTAYAAFLPLMDASSVHVMNVSPLHQMAAVPQHVLTAPACSSNLTFPRSQPAQIGQRHPSLAIGTNCLQRTNWQLPYFL